MENLLYLSQEFKDSIFTPFKKSKNIVGSFGAVLLISLFDIEKKTKTLM